MEVGDTEVVGELCLDCGRDAVGEDGGLHRDVANWKEGAPMSTGEIGLGSGLSTAAVRSHAPLCECQYAFEARGPKRGQAYRRLIWLLNSRAVLSQAAIESKPILSGHARSSSVQDICEA